MKTRTRLVALAVVTLLAAGIVPADARRKRVPTSFRNITATYVVQDIVSVQGFVSAVKSKCLGGRTVTVGFNAIGAPQHPTTTSANGAFAVDPDATSPATLKITVAKKRVGKRIICQASTTQRTF